MSKHKKKQKNISLAKEYSGYRAKPLPSSDWQRLAANPTLSGAFQELATRLQSAQATAEQRAVRSGIQVTELVDYSHALQVIDAHPELLPYLRELQSGERREMLRQSTMSPDFIRQSPTQSYPQATGNMGGWTGSKDAPIGVPNHRVLRDMADNNPWCRAAINVRREQISRADIAVIPEDPKRKYNKKTQYGLELMLSQPNELRQNWSELSGGVTDDILALSRGAISKSMTVDRKPIALYAEDASTIKIYANWDGNPDKPRYLFEEPGTSRKVPLRNDELIMMIMNPATYRFGLSPVQVLRETIEADLEATKQALRMMKAKPPPHGIQIPGASRSQLESLRDAYDRDIAGLKEIFFFGGSQTATHFPLIFSAKDNQFLEYQEYMVRKICAIFLISTQQLSMTFDINRATSATQKQISEDQGLIPLLLMWEEYLNRELVADYAPPLPYGRFDLAAVNLRILFPMVSEQARQLHAMESLEMASKGLAGLPSLTLNQVLAARGEEPVKGGDTFWLVTATGAVPWLSYDGETGDFTPISTGGAMGSQDASGGPSTDSDDPEMISEEDDEPNASEEAPAPSSSSDSGSASGGSQDAGKSWQWHDTRPFGKPWKPAYMHRVSEPIIKKSKEKSLIPPGEAKARQRVVKEVKKIFKEVAERGKKG